MIRNACYAAKLITLHEVSCKVNHVALPGEEKVQIASTTSKWWLDVCGVSNVCVQNYFDKLLV
jgi:hypothetical protein